MLKKLTGVEVEREFLKVVALLDGVDEFAAHGRLGVHAERQRRVHLHVLGHAVRVELLVEDGHRAVDHLDVHFHLAGARSDACDETVRVRLARYTRRK
jgi:hypothetical protein